jgi:hypothetical protein
MFNPILGFGAAIFNTAYLRYLWDAEILKAFLKFLITSSSGIIDAAETPIYS